MTALNEGLMEQMLESENLRAAWREVEANRGAAGVDGISIESFLDYIRPHWETIRAKVLEERYKPAEVKRVYIPNSSGGQRPLGIPTVLDRCHQAMVKNALEPEWEARFEPTSYGFRPGRSCQDAMSRIHGLAQSRQRKKWVIDADIKGAFDNICHTYLLNAIGHFPARELVKQWLKAGYVELGRLHETPAGTPQGGIVTLPTILQIMK